MVRDPEIRVGNGGQTVARFTIAVDRRFVKKDGNDTRPADFILCTAFGRIAEFIEKYFHKGMRANICGHIQTGAFKNRDGMVIHTTEVMVDEIEFGESKAASERNHDGETPLNTGVNHYSQPEPEPVAKIDDGFMEIPDNIGDELPFS